MGKTFQVLVGFFFLLTLGSCATDNASEIPTLTNTALPIQTPTYTETPKPTFTSTPSITPSPTSILVNFPTLPARNSNQNLPPNWHIVEILPEYLLKNWMNSKTWDSIHEYYQLGPKDEASQNEWEMGFNGVSAEIFYTEEEGLLGPYTISVIKDNQIVYKIETGLSPVFCGSIYNFIVFDQGWMLELVKVPDDPSYKDSKWSGWVSHTYFSNEDFTEEDIVFNGTSLNKLNGYDQSFGLHLIDGKPFYFFRKHDKHGFVYDDVEYFFDYADVWVYHCITDGGLWNPQRFENGVSFFARYESRDYYVLLGEIAPQP